jgi:hypothetical protein
VRTAGSQLAAQQARRPVTLTEQEAAWITAAGADLRAVFAAPTTSNVQRKQLFRAVITEIVVTVSQAGSGGERTAGLRIIWQGGASTELTVPLARTGQHSRVTSEETLGLVRRLAGHYNDTTIAQIPGQQGRRTATGLTRAKTHISQLRAYHDIPGYQPAAENVAPGRDDVLVVTIARAGHELGCPPRPSTGGYGKTSSSENNSPPARCGVSASTSSSATASQPGPPPAGSPSPTPPRSSGSPARPCCTRSSAASSTPSKSPRAAGKAYVSRQNTASLDCLIHPTERREQCAPCSAGRTKSAQRLCRYSAVARWQCRASAVITAPARSSPPGSGMIIGISFVFTPTSVWAAATPGSPARAASR